MTELDNSAGKRCRLLSPGLETEKKYWHCHKRKKMSLDFPKKLFLKALWPGRGLTWCEAVEISDFLLRPRVKCGIYKIPADSLLLEIYRA